MTAPSQNTFLAARPKIICGWHVFGGARRAPELPTACACTDDYPPTTRMHTHRQCFRRIPGGWSLSSAHIVSSSSIVRRHHNTTRRPKSVCVFVCVCWCSCMFVQRCDSALTSSISASDSPFSRRNRRLFGSNPSKSVCGSCARNIESEQTNKQKLNALACIAHGGVWGLDTGSRLDVHSHAYRTNVNPTGLEWIFEEWLALGWSL